MLRIYRSKKAELRWTPTHLHGNREFDDMSWLLGNVTTESGRVLENDVALDEACQMFAGSTITVNSAAINQFLAPQKV